MFFYKYFSVILIVEWSMYLCLLNAHILDSLRSIHV